MLTGTASLRDIYILQGEGDYRTSKYKGDKSVLKGTFYTSFFSKKPHGN